MENINVGCRKIGEERNFMLNVATREVWVDCFIDNNSWIEYNDKNIISLSNYIMENMEKQLTMSILGKYAKNGNNAKILEIKW